MLNVFQSRTLSWEFDFSFLDKIRKMSDISPIFSYLRIWFYCLTAFRVLSRDRYGVRMRSDSWGAVFAGTDESDVSYADVTITQGAQPNRISGKSTHLKSVWKILQRKGTKPLKNTFYWICRLKHKPGFIKWQRVDFS